MPNLSIHSKYQKSVGEVLQNIQREISVSDFPANSFLSQESGVSFGVVLDAGGIVLEAYHSGAEGAEKAILEKLCSLAIGKPLQEISDHGIIYVENSLRDPSVKNPVDGLLTYSNADSVFVRSNRLVRQCYSLYREKMSVKAERNFWTNSPQEAWTRCSDSEKKNKIKNCISELLASLKVFEVRFEVLEIVQEVRVVISITAPGMKGSLVGHWLMKIEKELKSRLEPRLEVILEDIEDRNKRLSRTQISREITA